MKKKIQYYLNKYRQKKIMYSCLAILGLLVCVSTSFILMQSAKADENQSVLSPTLQSSQLYYVDSNKNQIEITDSTQIPANVSLRYKVKYNKFSVDALKDTEYTLSYKIPDFLLNPKVESGQGNLVIAQENAGSIYVEDGYLKIKFNSQWLADKEGNNYTIEDLETWFDANMDLSKINPDGKITFNDGIVDKNLHFTPDIIARSVPIQVEKSLVSNQSSNSQDGKLLYIDGKYYLEYVLKVTLNSQNYKQNLVVNDIQVTDTFKKKDALDAYCTVHNEPITNNPNEDGLYVDENQNLIWKIPSVTLPSNQSVSKEIQYRIRLKDNYFQSASTSLENNAKVSIGNVDRATSPVVIYTPNEKLTLKKGRSSNDLIHYADGSSGIPYYVEISAPSNNSFVCKDVVFKDQIKSSNLNQYLSYKKDSIKLEKKVGNAWQSVDVKSSPVLDDQKQNSKGNENFTWNIGTISPGETYRITYVLRVDPSLQTFANAGRYTIQNQAFAYSGSVANKNLGSSEEHSYAYNQTTWASKNVSSMVMNNETVKMDGKDVVIPANHFKYTVDVNKDCVGNVNNTTFTDTLDKNGLLSYVGYAKIVGYTDSVDKPIKTAWLELDSAKSSFSFVPAKIGFDSKENLAYHIEYYVVASRGVVTTSATNTFKLSGTAQIGTSTVSFDKTIAFPSQTVQITQDGEFKQDKKGWYYDSKTQELYWLIDIKTGALTQGFVIQDTLQTPSSLCSFTEDSVVGVYKGLIDNLDEYDTMQEFKENNHSTIQLDGNTDYSVKKVNVSTLQIQLKKTQTFESNEHLYLIVKSKSAMPSSVRGVYTYTNGVQCGYNGNYSNLTKASYAVTGADSILKEYAGTFTYNGSNWQLVQAGRNGYGADKLLTPGSGNFKDVKIKNGTYLVWTILVNYAGGIQGDAMVEDTLPEGLELGYINYSWKGTGYTANTMPKVVGTEDVSGWQKKNSPMSVYNHKLPYYQNGNRVRFYIKALQKSHKTDQTAIEFQIVARVNDPNVLLGQQSTTFKNEASIFIDGEDMQDSSSSVNLTTTTLTKKVLNDSSENHPSKLDFEIVLNELSESLNGGNTLTLIDQMSHTLSLVDGSLHIYKSDGTELDSSNYKMGYDTSTHQISITVPDQEKLIIRYSAQVNAAPNAAVEINNQVYWRGYSVGPGGSFDIKDYKYSVGGTATLNDNPVLTIVKKDAADSTKVLKNATFRIQQLKKYNAQTNQFEDNVQDTLEIVTDEKGQAILDQSKIQYNTLYKIEEIGAPHGYVLDSTPKYFIDFNMVNGKYPEYTDSTIALDRYYSTPKIEYVLSNSLGSISFKKQFKMTNGDLYSNMDVLPNSLDGVYTFGIYEQDNTTCLKKVEMKVESGHAYYYLVDKGEKTQIDSLKFTGLDCTKTYRIQEIDSNGTFDIEYSNCENIQVNRGKEPVVTNISKPYVLPETGGVGTTWMYMIGMSCVICASGLYIKSRKKK